MTIRLTPTPQGHNDVYWCQTGGRAVVVGNGTCPACRSNSSDRNWGSGWWGHDFLAHVHRGDDVKNEVLVVAETVKGVDDAEAEIDILRGAIDHFAQQVHQAYHGAQEPDLCDVNHRECSRGLCRSVQHVLNPKRKRGIP